MTTAKAWVAFFALIVTSITASDIVPVTGTWHTVWVFVTIIVGSAATYFVPNKPKTIEGEVVNDAV